MKNKSIPPFYVGQEVVCIDNNSYVHSGIRADSMLKRGSVYIVKDIKQSACCQKWVVYVGTDNGVGYVRCSKCGVVTMSGKEDYFVAARFAPITSQFKTIEYSSVIEKETETVGAN